MLHCEKEIRIVIMIKDKRGYERFIWNAKSDKRQNFQVLFYDGF